MRKLEIKDAEITQLALQQEIILITKIPFHAEPG